MRILAVVGVLFAALFLAGMGGLGGAPEGTIPETEEDIRARVTDRQGMSTDLRRFSMDGKTFLSGSRGSATVTIPFARIDHIDFGESAGNAVPAQVQLAGGERLPLRIDRRAVFYGSTGYGSYQVRARDLRRIDFRPETAR